MDRDAIIGCIFGTAVGDALGLPYEGVSAKRAPRLLGPPDRYRFFFGRGMISDDTEHTCMVAQSLIEANGDVDLFARRFASRLRWWILALPAGVGKATARAGFKLWLSHPKDYRQAVTTIIECGGDADTTAAIVGGIVGAGVGEAGIPTNWIDGIWEYPRSVGWMRSLGECLASSTTKAPSINPIAVLLRNVLFLFIVLFHGFRRLAPPY